MVKQQWILDEEDYQEYAKVRRENEQVRGFNENLTREIQSMRQTIGDLMKERDILKSELASWRKDLGKKISPIADDVSDEAIAFSKSYIDKFVTDKPEPKEPKKETFWDAFFNGSIIGMAWNLSKKKKK